MRSAPPLALLAASLSTALAACSGADNPSLLPPAGSVVVPVAPPEPTAGAAPGDDQPAPAPQLAAIDFPPSSACVLQASNWRPSTVNALATPLTLRAEGPAFARVRGGQARLSYPEGERAAAQIIEIADAGLTIRGLIAPGEVDLRAATSFSLSGFVYPTVSTRLVWVEGKVSALVLTVELPAGLAPVAPLRATRACADVAIGGAGSWRPEDQLAAGRPTTAMEITGSRPVTLWSEPGKGALAELRAPPGPLGVSVLARNGKYAEITWAVETVVVHGWVEGRLLVPARPGLGYGTGSGRGGGRAPHDEERVVQCAADVAVTAEMGDTLVRVGEIAAGTRIEVLAHEGDPAWAGVRVRDARVTPEKGAAFVADRVTLSGCALAPR